MKDSLIEELFSVSRDNRVPLIVNLEVTNMCNLDCMHCYHTGHDKLRGEMSLNEIRALLASAKELGAMFLVLTGGEPFMRDDACEILVTAKDMGYLIVLFTNGTLVEENKARILYELSPFSVHVTLFSRNKKVNDMIAGMEGYHERVLSGIDIMRKCGIDTIIKTPVMKENIDFIGDIREWAEKEGLKIRVDPFISPCYSGNACDIIGHRIPPADMGKVVFDKETTAPGNIRYRTELECSAGKNMCGISPGGEVYPCIAWRKSAGDLKKEDFKDIWDNIKPDYSGFGKCAACEDLKYCGMCPGVASIEGTEVFCGITEIMKKGLPAAAPGCCKNR
ncbi:MAG: radical SAM protein [Elusimicrobia bacterium]|nr:radical SAM protein [Elusimicrobiota bacterium]